MKLVEVLNEQQEITDIGLAIFAAKDVGPAFLQLEKFFNDTTDMYAQLEGDIGTALDKSQKAKEKHRGDNPVIELIVYDEDPESHKFNEDKGWMVAAAQLNSDGSFAFLQCKPEKYTDDLNEMEIKQMFISQEKRILTVADHFSYNVTI